MLIDGPFGQASHQAERTAVLAPGPVHKLYGMAQCWAESAAEGLVRPSRSPQSRSAWRTHFRSVSDGQPILLAIVLIAPPHPPDISRVSAGDKNLISAAWPWKVGAGSR